MEENSIGRTSMIGARAVGSAISLDQDTKSIHKTNRFYWDTAGNDFLGAIVLPLYGAFVSEETHRLFGVTVKQKSLVYGK